MPESHDEQSRRRIGVYDYNSLWNLLINTFERLYPDTEPHDPQEIIQLMEAEILSWRRTGHGPH